MNTFLVSPDFTVCAEFLDNKRLNRQLSECIWVAESLIGKKTTSIGQMRNHPVLALWRDNTDDPLVGPLRRYQKALGEVWEKRFSTHGAIEKGEWMDEYDDEAISWHDAVHQSHRSSLARKDPTYYTVGRFFCFGFPKPPAFKGYAWLNPVRDV